MNIEFGLNSDLIETKIDKKKKKRRDETKEIMMIGNSMDLGELKSKYM